MGKTELINNVIASATNKLKYKYKVNITYLENLEFNPTAGYKIIENKMDISKIKGKLINVFAMT